MKKYNTNTSKETILESEKMAKATQKPGQTKEQTKLIAQGIQKGIEHFKKQQKAKSRELSKKLRSVNKSIENTCPPSASHLSENEELSEKSSKNKLPWILLVLSWLVFIIVEFYFGRF